MRLFVSALLLAATLSAATAVRAQEYVPQKSAKNSTGVAGMEGLATDLVAHRAVPWKNVGCPVMLTSAQLNWPASYLPTDSAEKVTEPDLALGFLNSSGRSIRSVGVTAALRVKKNIYALDAAPVELQLRFAGTGDLDKDLSHLTTISLPKGLHAYGVVQVRLDQVVFADGSLWMAPADDSCGLTPNGLEQMQAK